MARRKLQTSLWLRFFAFVCCVLFAFGVGVALIAFKSREGLPSSEPVPALSRPATVQVSPPPFQTTPRGEGESSAPTELPQYEEIPPASVLSSAPAPPIGVLGGQRKIAIVIDDVGPDVRRSAEAVALPAPLTLAFLPYGSATPRLAREAAAAGHDVLVHMPMEPEDAVRHDPGPHALVVGLSPEALRTRLRNALADVPQAIGLNNHMGSRFTTDVAGMRVVLAELGQRNLLFLDSRTTPDSVGRVMAQRHGVRFAGRDVFLDNVQDGSAIRRQLAEAERLARTRGQAIAIGHPHPETLAALRLWIPDVQARGFALVPLRDLAVTEPEETSP